MVEYVAAEMALNQPLSGTGTVGWTYTTGQR
jgi:hypothetical protein